jgi:hypothetical protein
MPLLLIHAEAASFLEITVPRATSQLSLIYIGMYFFSHSDGNSAWRNRSLSNNWFISLFDKTRFKQGMQWREFLTYTITR